MMARVMPRPSSTYSFPFLPMRELLVLLQMPFHGFLRIEQHEFHAFEDAHLHVVDDLLVLRQEGAVGERVQPIELQPDLGEGHHPDREILRYEIRYRAEPRHDDGVDDAGHRALLEDLAVELDDADLAEVDTGQPAVGRQERCVAAGGRHADLLPFQVLRAS